MNKITNIKILFLIAAIVGFNVSIAQVKQKQIEPIVFTSKSTNHKLSWNRNSNVAVLVVVSETKVEPAITNFDNYVSQAEFRKGSNVDNTYNSYVVYKGIENEVELSGLKANVDHYVWVYETNAWGVLRNINHEVFGDATPLNGNQKTTAVVCPAVGGITCTLNGSSTSGYSGGPAPCNTGAFAGSNPWDGASCTGFISFTFSSPVKTTVIKMIAVNTAPENTTISQSGGSGGTLTTSAPTCMSVAGLVCGPYTGSGFYGDVSVTVGSTGTYLTLTCTNTGCNSGWVASCPTFISVLPVELMSFTAECNIENVVDLKWKTMTETNNAFFAIERSSNTEDWVEIGRVKGAGTSTKTLDYAFTDRERFGGTMYYRIKQYDFNGDTKNSDMVSARNCKVYAENVDDVSFYPNPTSGEITVNSNSDATIMEVYSTLGIVVAKLNLEAGENKFNTSDLANGTYYIKVSDATQASKMTRLVVNH
jgi:hypothetical protein